MNPRKYQVGIAVLILAAAMLGGCASPFHMYLTWQNDPATTMTVNFQTPRFETEGVVYYDTEPKGDDPAAYRFKAAAAPHEAPLLGDRRAIYSVELSGLEPGTTYHFIYGVEGKKFSRPRFFRTIPNDGSPLRFVDGGDVSILPRARRLLKQAAATDPAFISIGGDIAYENGDPKKLLLYDQYLQMWETALIAPDGRVIPGVFALGNHETNKKHEEPELNAPYFFGFFPQGGSPYFARKFGPDLLFLVLDSGHTVPQDGAQLEWLKATLEENASVPVKIATYHVPLYPSHRPFDEGPSEAARTYWLPLFDKYKLSAGLEHHDHTFKKSKPLRNGEVNPEGTVYLGDGCMGVPPRDIKNKDAWYLENASDTPHFWVIDVKDGKAAYQAVNIKGEVFDRYPAE